MKTMLVSWLMRLYPKAWRNEYGAELADMLRARPLTPGTCLDVGLSAIWQRLRAVEISTLVGIAMMLVMMASVAWNIFEPPPYGVSYGRPTIAERIELLQRPLDSEFYVLVLAGVGFWSAWRGRARSSRAAVRVAVIASMPLFVVGVLTIVGSLDFVELHPGQTPTSFEERGILYTFYSARRMVPVPGPITMLLAPLLRIPGAWMWGVIGGGLGRLFKGWLGRPVSA